MEQLYNKKINSWSIERQKRVSFADFLQLRGVRNVRYWTSVNLQNMLKKTSQKFDNLKSSNVVVWEWEHIFNHLNFSLSCNFYLLLC